MSAPTTPCHHVGGHASGAHAALCLAIRRAQEHRHALVPGAAPVRLLVRAYELERTRDTASILRATRDLEDFARNALDIENATKPEKTTKPRRAAA